MNTSGIAKQVIDPEVGSEAKIKNLVDLTFAYIPLDMATGHVQFSLIEI